MENTYDRFIQSKSWRGNSVLKKNLFEKIEYLLNSFLSNTTIDKKEYLKIREKIHKELEDGSGVFLHRSKVLKYLDKQKFYDVFNRFSLWLGIPAPINKLGDYIKEVSDTGVKDSLNHPQRGHMTNQELAFHSDRADLTILCCWSPANEGGLFRVRSSIDVVRGLEEKYQGIKKQLRKSIAHDLRGEAHINYCYIPILYTEKNNFVFRYIRKFNDSVIRHGIYLSEEEINLLNKIDAEINITSAYAEIFFEKGVIAIVNNHITLHMRTEFKNSLYQKRCLLRCWLSSERTRELPESFMPLFHNVEAGKPRGGIK